jgi:hypothetical protein
MTKPISLTGKKEIYSNEKKLEKLLQSSEEELKKSKEKISFL